MRPTLDRGRRFLRGSPTPADAARSTVEDVVIVFGVVEIEHLRGALEALLGDTVERPDTPARIERALDLVLARRGAPGRARVLRRPAALSTPESWEIHLDGTDRASGTAVREAGRTGVHRVLIETVCLQCGTPATQSRGAFCRRCGLPYGQAPRATAELPSCPICYRTVDDDGRLPGLDRPGARLDLVNHRIEHERHPVGDDDWLETLREGDRIRIERWTAPFETVRRYLVTGQVNAGRNRQLAHDLIVTAMTQIARWGPNGLILGDQPEWQAARAAVVTLMERYALGRCT